MNLERLKHRNFFIISFYFKLKTQHWNLATPTVKSSHSKCNASVIKSEHKIIIKFNTCAKTFQLDIEMLKPQKSLLGATLWKLCEMHVKTMWILHSIFTWFSHSFSHRISQKCENSCEINMWKPCETSSAFS